MYITEFFSRQYPSELMCDFPKTRSTSHLCHFHMCAFVVCLHVLQTHSKTIHLLQKRHCMRLVPHRTFSQVHRYTFRVGAIFSAVLHHKVLHNSENCYLQSMYVQWLNFVDVTESLGHGDADMFSCSLAAVKHGSVS